MKASIYILGLVLISILAGCNSPKKKEAETENLHLAHTPEEENSGHKIDYDKTKVISTVYVINRNGAEMKQDGNSISQTLGKYSFGDKLDVIEINGDWLGVRDRVMRTFQRNGSTIESTGWEKVYVQKKLTGQLEDITLVKEDLNIISSIKKNGKTETFEEGKALSDFLKIELIDKSLFNSQKPTAVNFLLSDTTSQAKKKGIVELICKQGTKKYIDKPDEEEDIQIYNYVGQIEFLNKYLISGTYYESYEYKFIDKDNCKETQTFIDFPYISPDKKNIICVYTNPYEITGDLELFLINNKSTKAVMSTSFKNWMPASENNDMFWSSDGYLYLPVMHTKAFWKADGNLNDKFQYIRIKAL